jgi:DNA helicase-2/ATP-dependent DNA helicase PcrA
MSQLNYEQEVVVECNHPYIVCLAGAGTGKTFSMLHRINRLIADGVSPQSILVLTFTNAAAQNMRDRFEGANSPEFKTFHAFCYSLIVKDAELRRCLGYDFIPHIISDAEYKLLVSTAKLDSGVKLSAKQLHGENLTTPNHKFEYTVFQKFLDRLLQKNNAITFDKICNDVCKLFVEDSPLVQQYKYTYKVIMVDEFQDSDEVQWRFVTSFPDASIFVVGDALQNLYSFRGTTSRLIKELAADPNWATLRLMQNYRSTKQICRFANSMSHYADNQYRIEIRSEREGSDVIVDTIDTLDKHISDYLSLGGVTAVLCRTNKEVDNIRTRYAQYFMNYEKYLQLCYSVDVYESCLDDMYAVTFLSKFLSQDEFVEFIRQRSLNPELSSTQLVESFNNESVHKYFDEILQLKLQLGDTSSYAIHLMQLAEFYNIDKDILWEVSSDITCKDDVIYALSIIILKYKDSNAGLYVGTIHSAKGLEYDNVILNRVHTSTFRLDNEDNFNLYYVGITRAKNNLCVLKGNGNE